MCIRISEFWIVRNFEIVISGAGFTLMLVMVCANVFTRNFLNYSIPFAMEVSYLGFGYSVFFGTSLLYRKHALISVTVVFDRLSKTSKYYVSLLNFSILTCANAYLAYISFILAQDSWFRLSPYLEYPYFFVALAPAIAFGLMTIYSINFFLRSLRGKDLETISSAEANATIESL